MQRLLMYDCEIIKCIPNSRGIQDPRVTYCEGWRDFQNMGISVIGTWRNFDLIIIFGKIYAIPLPFGKYQAFINHDSVINTQLYSLPDFLFFQFLSAYADSIIGFNSIAFDDRLCHANGLVVDTDFDLLCEVRERVGQPREYVYGVTKAGYNLNNLAEKNGLGNKTGTGELAPKLWQMGHKDRVISYCLNDVKLLKQLYFKFQNGLLRDPNSLKMI